MIWEVHRCDHFQPMQHRIAESMIQLRKIVSKTPELYGVRIANFNIEENQTHMIDLLLLGTGAMVPLPHRWLSSTLVRIDASLVLLDCGEGTQIAMHEHGWGFKKLDAIVLSHHHADHVAGLPGMFHSLANSGRTERLDIYGPPGTDELVTALRFIARDLPYKVQVTDVEGGESALLAGGLKAKTVWAEHRVPCLAWRFDLPRAPAFHAQAATDLGIPRDRWSVLQRGESVEIGGTTYVPEQVLKSPRAGVSFGLATDTRPTPAIAELMQGVDLLISEATYAEDSWQELAAANGHMTFGEAARMAKASNSKHLWLTHFSARIANPEIYREIASSIFPNVTIGHAGLTGTLRFETGYERMSDG